MKYSLPVTGAFPLTFDGELIATATSYDPDKRIDRGFTLTIYRTSETWLGHIEYITRWRAEAPTSRVLGASDARGLACRLLTYNPLTDVIGYPEGQQFAAKQQRLHATLKLKWDSLVGTVLVQVPQMATQS